MLYVWLISACIAILTVIFELVYGFGVLYTLGFTALAVALVIAVDAVAATVFRLLPAKFASHDKKCFSVSLKEKKFYEKMKIRKWKDYIPEIGHFTGFRKNKIADPKSPEYIDRFLLEICYGQLGHFYSIFFGFLILLLFPITPFWLPLSISVAIINIFFNLPSLFILRYNSYKLKVLRKSLEKKQVKAKATRMESVAESA